MPAGDLPDSACAGHIVIVAIHSFPEAIMKDLLNIFRNSLESAGAQALDATRREYIRAREDLRKIYGRTWSDRGHL
jgi:hypothetical protein